MKYDVIVNDAIINTIVWDGVTPIYQNGYQYFDTNMDLITTTDFELLEVGTHNYQRNEPASEEEFI